MGNPWWEDNYGRMCFSEFDYDLVVICSYDMVQLVILMCAHTPLLLPTYRPRKELSDYDFR